MSPLLSSLRLAFVAALAIGCHGALAQTAVPPALSVQRAAPQLVTFAGSQSNFQNLVNGLAQGTQVQLVTVLPDGSTQLVTFTPTAAIPPDQIAQVLESARQRLIGLGIGNPTAEQLAVALTGGTVPTALGGTQVSGLLGTQSAPSPAAQVQSTTSAAAGATASAATTSTAVSPVSVQVLPPVGTAAAGSTAPLAAPRFNTSDSALPAGVTSRSPPLTTSVTPVLPTAPNPAQAAVSTPATREGAAPTANRARH